MQHACKEHEFEVKGKVKSRVKSKVKGKVKDGKGTSWREVWANILLGQLLGRLAMSLFEPILWPHWLCTCAIQTRVFTIHSLF